MRCFLFLIKSRRDYRFQFRKKGCVTWQMLMFAFLTSYLFLLYLFSIFFSIAFFELKMHFLFRYRMCILTYILSILMVQFAVTTLGIWSEYLPFLYRRTYEEWRGERWGESPDERNACYLATDPRLLSDGSCQTST